MQPYSALIAFQIVTAIVLINNNAILLYYTDQLLKESRVSPVNVPYSIDTVHAQCHTCMSFIFSDIKLIIII